MCNREGNRNGNGEALDFLFLQPENKGTTEKKKVKEHQVTMTKVILKKG